jgi:hypothetical protein
MAFDGERQGGAALETGKQMYTIQQSQLWRKYLCLEKKQSRSKTYILDGEKCHIFNSRWGCGRGWHVELTTVNGINPA